MATLSIQMLNVPPAAGLRHPPPPGPGGGGLAPPDTHPRPLPLQILADKEDYLRRTPAFKYRSHEDLSSAVYTSKTSLRMFDGSGYAHDFDVKDEDAFDEVTDLLSATSWVDAATRFLVVEMTLYSPATDLVAAVFFMVRAASAATLVPLRAEAERCDLFRAFVSGRFAHTLGIARALCVLYGVGAAVHVMRAGISCSARVRLLVSVQP